MQRERCKHSFIRIKNTTGRCSKNGYDSRILYVILAIFSKYSFQNLIFFISVNHPSSRRGICLASILSSIQTFSGIFAVHSYASTIFSRAGGILDPFTSTIIYGASMCVGAIMPLFLVDRSGRKVKRSFVFFSWSIRTTVA